MTNTYKDAILYCNDAMGVYIPQHFAESFYPDKWKYINQDDIDILLIGPNDNESYWDAWQDVLDNAETLDGGTLYQDGDLWVVYMQGAIDIVNGYCEAQLEYEESHIDAGNNYAHMPSESWTMSDEKNMLDQFKAIEHYASNGNGLSWQELYPAIDPMGLSNNAIAELALDNFKMVSGHRFGLPDSYITLAAYPIQEVELQLDHYDLGIDEFTFDLIRESCDVYIKGGYGYMGSDVVWYAAIERDELQALIRYKVKGE